MSTSRSGSSDGRSLLQRSIYVGLTVQNILYGMELLLYFKTFQALLRNKRVCKGIFYALFSSVMVFLITIWVATSAIFCQNMWLLDTNFTGGPNKYWEENLSVWYMDLGTTAAILLQLMTDGLVIHRCWIIWNSGRAIVIPIFLWLFTLVLGILVDYTSSLPGGNFFVGVSAQLVLAYYTISASLNTILTCMIYYRIMQHGKKVKEQLGDEYASPYFAVATLIIESVLPYTLSGIAFLVSLGVKSLISEAFILLYIMMMCISPQMLILRVVSGKAWSNDTSIQAVSTIKFSTGSSLGSEQMDDSGSRIHLRTGSQAHIPKGHGMVVISPV